MISSSLLSDSLSKKEAVKCNISNLIISKKFPHKAPAIKSGKLPYISLSVPPEIDEQLEVKWEALTKLSKRGEYRFLGTKWPGITDVKKWHVDPITKGSWPSEKYCFNIAYRHERKLGDVKFILELNRLQFLQPMAAYAVMKQDEKLTQYCVSEIESWIDTNPPYHGVNWCSGIELSSRVVSLLIVIGLIGEKPFTPEQNKKLRQTLYDHAYWIDRYPSKFSSANNHLIAEAAALFVIGTLASDLPNARKFEAKGRRIISEEALKQIHPDGVGGEQSPTYTAYTLEWISLCCKIADDVQKPLPKQLNERLKVAAQHLRFITDQGNNQPHIGDNDEGRVIYSQFELETHYSSSILSCISAYFNTPEVAPPQLSFHLRNYIFGIPKPKASTSNGIKSFKHGGYTIVREIVKSRQLMLAIDHGPLGYLSIAAHGHADALAVWLHIDDQPIFIDAGTYLYHSGAAWRDYFRGTLAHNTLNINQKNQSTITGPFNWSRRAKAKLNAIIYENNRHWSIDVQHNGYLKEFGVIHRRKISKNINSELIIHDHLIGKSTPKQDDMVELRYLISPNLNVSQEKGGQINISQDQTIILSLKILTGKMVIERAIYSPSFAKKAETSVIVIRTPLNKMLKTGMHTCITIHRPS